MKLILQKLGNIECLLSEARLLKKEVLTFKEAAQYLDLSESYLYKLTHTRSIPHYSPQGKKLYFKRKELDQWLTSCKRPSSEEMIKTSVKITNK